MCLYRFHSWESMNAFVLMEQRAVWSSISSISLSDLPVDMEIVRSWKKCLIQKLSKYHSNLSPMRAAKVQASLRIRAVSPEPPLLAHTSSESRGTFRQKGRSLAPLNGWACAVKICDDGMLEDTNSLDGAHIMIIKSHYARRYMSSGMIHGQQSFHEIVRALNKF